MINSFDSGNFFSNYMKNTINYEDFAKLDIRMGTVVSCENVPKSNKLLKLEVDFGGLGIKQILTGMATWYNSENYVGKQFPFIVNLEPRKMMGLESQGMMLSVGTDFSKKPILLLPEEEVENGEGIS